MKNLGTWDRVLRILVGLAVFCLLFTDIGDLRWLGTLGLIPIATALIGWCPIYQMFDIFTNLGDDGKPRAR
jgi:hypothetical protein